MLIAAINHATIGRYNKIEDVSSVSLFVCPAEVWYRYRKLYHYFHRVSMFFIAP